MKANLEKFLEIVIDPANAGLPAIIALKELKRAKKKGAVIPDSYAYVDDAYLEKVRADCLQAMGVNAWEKAKDENRSVKDRLEFIEILEKHKKKGGFGWQVFGITESDF